MVSHINGYLVVVFIGGIDPVTHPAVYPPMHPPWLFTFARGMLPVLRVRWKNAVDCSRVRQFIRPAEPEKTTGSQLFPFFDADRGLRRETNRPFLKRK
jgi:hypothetical protein